LDRLPTRPGVYLMKDLDGRVIYVGKAKILRSRVRSYFRASGDERAFVAKLDKELGDIEVIVTPSEKDALILERKLIQRNNPRYNIDLVDDKNFLSIRISSDHSFPRLMLERRRVRGSNPKVSGRWFGPYTSAAAARQTFRLLQSALQLRTCNDRVFGKRKRACLLHQMNRCLGPCVQKVSVEVYARRVKQAIKFLRGRLDEMVADLNRQMKSASAELRYEDAAKIRDKITAARQTLERQPLIDPAEKDRDIVGLHREGTSGMVILMQVRKGSLLGASRYPFSKIEVSNADLVRQLLAQHYHSGADLPREILMPIEALAGAEDCYELQVLADWLTDQHSFSVKVAIPSRGHGARLVEVARDNAREAFLARLATASILTDRLLRLERRLGLSRLPRRIECFDMSTLGGKYSVGSLAVLYDGEPMKSAYRRYRIKSAAPDSDLDMMREVVARRFRPVLEGSQAGPDLVVLDGGKGQLKTIQTLFADLGLDDVDLVALAKGRSEKKKGKPARERVFIPGRKNPIMLRPESDELFLLSRVRDEAHRFAVSYHRKLRSKTSLRSLLEEIPGVGPVLRKRLLSHFGSLRAVRKATATQLGEVSGVTSKLGQRIFEFLATFKPGSPT